MCNIVSEQTLDYLNCSEWNPNESSDQDYLSNETSELVLTNSRKFVPDLGVQIIWSCLFAFIVLVSVIGNVTVIWIITGHRQMRTVTNFFLLNLTISDLISSIFNTAFNFVYMLHNNWIFGEPYCKINNFIANMTVASSVFTITATSFDR